MSPVASTASRISRQIAETARGELRRQSQEAMREGRLRPTQVVPHSSQEAPGYMGSLDYAQIIRPTIQYEIFNPSDDPMEFGYNGETYVLPGASDLWVGRDAHTGELMEYTRPGVMPVFGRPEVRIDARTILEHAVGPDGRTGFLGVNGVRPLFGDERDEVVMEEARVAWVDKKRYDCEALTRAHERQVADLIQRQENPPRPSKRVRDAYRWISENERRSGMFIACPVCNDGFPAEREMQLHLITIHKRHPLADDARAALGLADDILGTDVEVEKVREKPIPTSLKGGGEIISKTEGGTLSDEEAERIQQESEARKDAERLKKK